MTPSTHDRPEYNVTGLDYADRRHFRYRGPIIDIHAHVMLTHADDPKAGPPPSDRPGATADQAAVMLDTGAEFGIVQTVTMCPAGDISVLRDRFGDRLCFNGSLMKSPDEPEAAAYRLLDRFLEAGVKILKLWSAPRGRERGLFVNAPWRRECLRRARAAGVRIVMVHVADPDVWFRTVYADAAKFGTKSEQYVPLRAMLEEFPDLQWIGAHMGGDPEHPEHLEELLATYPHFSIDTSATKWQVREVSPRAEAIRGLVCRYPDRFLFGTDLVTRHSLVREHYVSRYWCQRTLWESAWAGPSPIADPDCTPSAGSSTPTLRGVELPMDVLNKVYFGNAQRLLGVSLQLDQGKEALGCTV
jgi:predicted TIM-barrel fold metal-dependent hydrolase